MSAALRSRDAGENRANLGDAEWHMQVGDAWVALYETLHAEGPGFDHLCLHQNAIHNTAGSHKSIGSM